MELTELQIKELANVQYQITEDKSAEQHKSERRIVHFISTPQLDRGRDIMNPKGMDATDFLNTKTVFLNHNYDAIIGANVKLISINEGVKATTYFSDKTQLAKDVYNLHIENILNSWSIGFMPVRDKQGNIEKDSVVYDEEKDIRTFNKWILFEYSSTGIPMNPGALDIAKSICKSFELTKEIETNRELINLNELIKSHNTEIETLKTLINELQSKNNSDITNEINEIKTRLEYVGKANVKLDTDFIKNHIQKLFVGALNEVTGRKIKL